ncbi:hypothetical protein SKAU_G00125240 [Synaphobranchus kaupii]|uniref:Uncharacterized protein n=1 Tax=Synaphobranchus kaupii TaxID=118154 RepID=A0A9Q1J2U2_SYNKA|nr:hypothetical protein SKAU_G00125240 [Synaphobranchus kaupii]
MPAQNLGVVRWSAGRSPGVLPAKTRARKATAVPGFLGKGKAWLGGAQKGGGRLSARAPVVYTRRLVCSGGGVICLEGSYRVVPREEPCLSTPPALRIVQSAKGDVTGGPMRVEDSAAPCNGPPRKHELALEQ